MAQETATPATPATGTATAQPASTVNRGAYADAFADIEELEAKTAPPAKPAPSDKPADKAKPATVPAAKTDLPKTDEVTVAKTGDDDTAKTGKSEADKELEAADDPAKLFKTAHDLRKDWSQKKKRLQALETENRELRTKAESKNGSPPTALLEENKALKKALDEAQTELRYENYTKSQEFRDKHEKPYKDAFADAVEEVRELRVTLPDGNSRPATEQDFERVLNADHQDVRAVANELFGDAAPDVLALRRKLVDMNRNASREAKRYREQAAQREQQRAAQKAESDAAMKAAWETSLTEIADQYPQYFKPKEGDDEYNAALAKGYELVDKAHDPSLPIKDRIVRLAGQRHRAAAFRAQVLVSKRLAARVAELEGVVKGYEESAPRGGKGGSEAARTGKVDDGYVPFADEIDALEARSGVHAA